MKPESTIEGAVERLVYSNVVGSEWTLARYLQSPSEGAAPERSYSEMISIPTRTPFPWLQGLKLREGQSSADT